MNIEERVLDLDSEVVEGRHRDSRQGHAWMRKEFDSTNGNDSQERDNIGEQLADSLLLEDEPDEKSDAKFIRREKVEYFSFHLSVICIQWLLLCGNITIEVSWMN